jgi:hypothetical protein
MALQGSGAISLSEIQTEFGGANPISLSEYYRDGSYTTSNNTSVPTSGAISFSNFYGGTSEFTLSITSNTENLDVRSAAVAAGWDESSPLAVNISSGVYVWSDTTATAGMVISGTFSNGVTIINSGYIIGKGGNVGLAGGAAVSNSSSGVSIVNNSGAFIAGGGGGGGISGGGGGGAGGGYIGGGAVGQNGGDGASKNSVSVSINSPYAYQGDCGINNAGYCQSSTFGQYIGTITGATIAGGAGGTDIRAGGSTGAGPSNISGSGVPEYYPSCCGGGLTGRTSGTITSTGNYGNGGGGSRRLSASSNLDGTGTNGGGGWGRAGLGTGAGAAGAAITGTSVSLTNNGTVYGAT